MALLGDSTFDNAAYTDGGADVTTHLNRMLVGTDRATLLARDGARIPDVFAQVERLEELLDPLTEPEPVTHVVLSVGGNDLLTEADVLGSPTESVASGMLAVRERAEGFARRYREVLERVLGVGLPTAVCTVYEGAFPDRTEARVIGTALRIFDHEILDVGLDRGVPVIDLRRVCSEPEDYWNPVEPSERGGAKIAAAVARAARTVGYDLNGKAVTIQGTAGM